MTSKLEADLDLRSRPSVFGVLTSLLFVPQDPALPPFTRCSTFYSMFLSLPTPPCTFRTRMGLQWPPTPSTAPAGVALWYGHTTETPEPQTSGVFIETVPSVVPLVSCVAQPGLAGGGEVL